LSALHKASLIPGLCHDGRSTAASGTLTVEF
jgi:hypothetical protein